MPSCISLFSGCGGADIGLAKHCDLTAAIEIDPLCCQIHQANFPNCTTIQADITRISGAEIRGRSRLKFNELDFLWSSPPCQSFSSESRRDPQDPRSKLLLEGCRLIVELQPKYFAIENVKGLTTGHCKDFLMEAIAYLKRHKYHVLDYRILNAKDYGTPQSRERVIVLGSRQDVQIPRYPEPSTYTPTVRDALGDLPEASNFEELWSQDWVFAQHGEPSKYAAKLRTAESDRPYLSQVLDYSRLTKHSEEVKERFALTAPNTFEPISRFFKLGWDGISNTLKAGSGSHTATRPIHPDEDRVVTVREYGRLQGFPDNFILPRSKFKAYRAIGNSVPPSLAEAIVKCQLSNYQF